MEEYQQKQNLPNHNFGQGLFYSGEIKLSRFSKFNKFRFIYDCGSENLRLINASIRRFKQDIGDNKIDLLTISHLHSDHVSGLNELFDNFTIKEVILPYFSPMERLLIALRRINLPRWYHDFLSDLVTYLFERGVKRVIVLGEEEGGEGGVPPEELPPSPPEEDIRNKLDIKLPEGERLKERIIRDENWQSEISNKQLIIKNHNGYILAFRLWIFRFFNYKIPPSLLRNFEECIRSIGFTTDNENIKKTITTKKLLKNLKDCYKRIAIYLRNDFNNTSLVLYHGPIGRLEEKNTLLCFCPCCFYSFIVHVDGFIEEFLEISAAISDSS